MGTKNNPGKFDCIAKAEPDEPFFTLLARDPTAAHLVSIWAKLRADDPIAARAVFENLLARLAQRGPQLALDMDKVAEATECSGAMFDWIKKNRPERAL